MGNYLADKFDFVKCLLLCHDCTTLDPNQMKGMAKKKIKSQSGRLLTGASLDEQALLQAVDESKAGWFIERSAKTLTINLAGNELQYDMICINEFSSERKLMSVVVRDQKDGKLYVFAKGAESQIMARLSDDSKSSAFKSRMD